LELVELGKLINPKQLLTNVLHSLVLLHLGIYITHHGN
jgi:hypothetical protein